MKIKVTDSLTVDANGPFRMIPLADGWCVTGEGLFLPFESEQEALDTLAEMERALNPGND